MCNHDKALYKSTFIFTLPYPSYPFLSSPLCEVAPQIQLRDFGEGYFPQQMGRTTFAVTRYVLCDLNTPKCVCGQKRPMCVNQNLKIEANVIVSECIVYVTVSSLIKFYVISLVICYTLCRGCFKLPNTPLVITAFHDEQSRTTTSSPRTCGHPQRCGAVAGF